MIIIILVLLLGAFFLRPKPNPNPPQLYTVKRQDIAQTVSTSGSLTGENVADLRFPSGGKLAFINVKAGDSVTQGESLAGLDATSLASNLQETQNTLAADQAAVEKIYDDIHLFQYGNGGFDNVGTANETQAQRNTRIAAEKTRDSAVDAVKAAQNALANSVITSPINGTITLANPVAGQNVLATDTIVEVADFTQEVFAADIDESDVGSIKIGQPADFTMNAYGDKDFKGTVSEIASVTHTTSSGSTAVTVKIAIDSASIKPIVGLNGQANITTAQKSNVIIIPSSALREDNTVVLQTPQGFVLRQVTPGLANDTDIEITNGLNENDIIVTNPQSVPNVSKLKKA